MLDNIIKNAERLFQTLKSSVSKLIFKHHSCFMKLRLFDRVSRRKNLSKTKYFLEYFCLKDRWEQSGDVWSKCVQWKPKIASCHMHIIPAAQPCGGGVVIVFFVFSARVPEERKSDCQPARFLPSNAKAGLKLGDLTRQWFHGHQWGELVLKKKKKKEELKCCNDSDLSLS